MNKYESVVIINPEVDEEGVKALENTFTDMINKNGKVSKVDELGKKKLAYEVKKCTEGNYVVFNFEAIPSLIAELERNYRITDEIIKFMVIKVEE
jgi:small subunit ribosomal protein S6